MNNKIKYLVLLYNTKIIDSAAYQCVKDNDVIIFDNSDEQAIIDFNKDFVDKHQLIYMGEGQNLGNYKAYNQVFDHMQNFFPDQHLVILDSDSVIDGDYQQVDINHDQACVYLPKIYSVRQKFVVFPHYYRGLIMTIARPLKKVRKIEAINSGMLFNNLFIKQYRYDEKFQAYCGDFALMDYVVKNNIAYQQIDVTIKQDFFVQNLEYTDKTYARLKLRMEDIRKYKPPYMFFFFKIFSPIYNAIRFRKLKILKLIFE